MNKIGYTVILVILGVIVLIALLMGQRSCLGAIQAWPTRVVVLSPTLTPPGPTPTLGVGEAAAATLRPEELNQAVKATRQSWVTPSPTPCGWQGLCPLSTATATPPVTANPVVVTATPATPPTSAASPIPVNACTATLTVLTPGGLSTIWFTEGVSLAYDAGIWEAGTRLSVMAGRKVDFSVSRPGLDYMYLPPLEGYEFRFTWPHPPTGEAVQGAIAHLLAGPQYHLRATYTEGQAQCQASVFFQVDP